MEKKQHKSRNDKVVRDLRLESLEQRRLLAADVAASATAFNALPGDVDGNGVVEFADFLRCASNFGSTAATWGDGDFNGDGQVDFADFTILSDNFGARLGDAVAASSEDIVGDDSSDNGREDDANQGNPDDNSGQDDLEDGLGDDSSEDDLDDSSEDGLGGDSSEDDSTAGGLLDDSGEDDLEDDSSLGGLGGSGMGNFDDDHSDDRDGGEDDRVEDDDHGRESDEDGRDDDFDDDGGSYGHNDLELEARLAGSGAAHGEAEFESEHGGSEREFEVHLEGGASNTTYAVAVDTIFAGNITTNSAGRGTLSLSTHPDGRDEQLLPADFPSVSAGSVVTVGDLLSGQFQFDD